MTKGEQLALDKKVGFYDAISSNLIFRADVENFRDKHSIPIKTGLGFELEKEWLDKNYAASRELEHLCKLYGLSNFYNSVLKSAILSELDQDQIAALSVQEVRTLSKFDLPNSEEVAQIEFDDDDDGLGQPIAIIKDKRIESLLDDKEEFPIIIEIGNSCSQNDFRAQIRDFWPDVQKAQKMALRTEEPTKIIDKCCRNRVYREVLLRKAHRSQGTGTPAEALKIINRITDDNLRDWDVKSEFYKIKDDLVRKKIIPET